MIPLKNKEQKKNNDLALIGELIDSILSLYGTYNKITKEDLNDNEDENKIQNESEINEKALLRF